MRVFGLKLDGNDYASSIVSLCQDKLGISIQPDDIGAAHPLNSRPGAKPAMIVRFRTGALRDQVLRARKKLKDTGISMAEDLTSLNVKLMKRLKNNTKLKDVWSLKGRIFATASSDGKKYLFQPFDDVDRVLALEPGTIDHSLDHNSLEY